VIPFNSPSYSSLEKQYLSAALDNKKICGDGPFTKRCSTFLEQKYGFRKVLLTTSCTDALEMTALLLDIQKDDEVILPSYTFVSSANAFVLRGAKIVFADSEPTTPNIDATALESLITPKTKAIVVVHYGGVACDMDAILAIAKKHNLYVVEDAAQAIDSFYKGKPLGSIGDLATFSFHETKNISSGEGGMLVINNERFCERAEIIREKGTNRAKFVRGEIAKYDWVDIGSSFLPSDATAAILLAQLERLEEIQQKRVALWNSYFQELNAIAQTGAFTIHFVPEYATNNAQLFYLVCKSNQERNALINYLRDNGIYAVFHYISLHRSPYFHSEESLPHCERYSSCLVRLPLYFDLSFDEVKTICGTIQNFYAN